VDYRRTGRVNRRLRFFPLNKRKTQCIYRIIGSLRRVLTAKMPNHKNTSKAIKMAIDGSSEKRKRGRPRECGYTDILGRAENYRWIFTQVWERLSGPLRAARNDQEVTEAFRLEGEPYAHEFVPRLAGDILAVIGEKKFPKRARAQIKFMANSLAGRPNVEPRTARDICAKGLAEEKARSPHTILRKEYYVECSCGFMGPALNDACRKCGAKISLFPKLFLGLE
jgi:hypothetical protein